VTTRLGVLFLGCGAATAMHSRTLRKLGDVDLLYASRDPRRAEEFARRYDGRRSFLSYEAALADAAVDVAVVATPTSTHLDLTLLAVRAGRHVIVEKPAFMRSADVAAARAAAQQAGRSVLVAENYFYKPVAALLRRLVKTGRLGDVRFVTVNATKRQDTRGWRDDPALSGGGALFEGGVHWVNFMASIGLEVSDLRAWRVGTRGTADVSTLTVFRYSNGAVGTLAHSWELPAPFGGMRLSKVQGTKGALTFESNGIAYVGSGSARGAGLPVLRGDFLGYRAMFRDFLSSIRTGEPAQFTLDLAERDLALLESAETSMNSAAAPTRKR
jgi:predicted dehydrogenase